MINSSRAIRGHCCPEAPPSSKDSHHRAPQASGQPPWHFPVTCRVTPGTLGPTSELAPRTFPSSVLYFLTTQCSREFPRVSMVLAHQFGGLTPALAQLHDQRKTSESATEMTWLNGWGAYLSEARAWNHTPPCAATDSGQNMAAGRAWGVVAVGRGEVGGRLQVIGELTSQVGSSVTREASKEARPHCTLEENSHQLGPGASG